MAKKTVRAGGFVAMNSGEIRNCYSLLQMNLKGDYIGGFASDNTGTISKSYSYSNLKKLTAGFSCTGEGNTEDACYFFHNEEEDSDRVTSLPDHTKGQRVKELEKEEDLQEMGFDTETVWWYSGEKVPLKFYPENWFYDVRESERYARYPEENIISISTADELFQLAEKINAGDPELAAAYIQLTEDIDLGGKEWIPIGHERTRAFKGLFDGYGHTISNFIIKNKEIENKGFFGILAGEVYNLSIDCRIQKASCSGGIAAQNENGIIGCCGAIVEIKGSEGMLGGLVGLNTGEVFSSYAAGRISAFVVPWFWWAWAPLASVAVVITLAALDGVTPTVSETTIFPPPTYDEDQIPAGDNLKPNAIGNFVSFQFEQAIDVSLDTGRCRFNFLNPGNSNHDIVVQLHFTDAQAIRVMGSTGRSAEEQAEIESDPSYDPETYRTIIAESNAIRPGYQLVDLKLVKHANGATIAPGSYNAMVYLVFYDIKTHNRAMMESQLPVVIEVH